MAASLLLLGVSAAAEELQHVLGRNLPDALGVGRYSVLWMLVMLTATGVAVGLVVWKVPDTPVRTRRPPGLARPAREHQRGRCPNCAGTRTR